MQAQPALVSGAIPENVSIWSELMVIYVDVRFKNQGLDLIEVQDNGVGISSANYESVCLKHHTSKLSTYDDLASLQTFGFRGEALASLCALSKLTITTCLATDVPKGTNLSFEASGHLEGTSVVAAQKGTSVSVEKLFHNLPVRRRELERNIKREWQKMIALLNQYACILTGLKFTVSQQPSKGKRIILFSTKGNATTRENIINIFSAKMTSQLVPLDLQLEMKPTISGHALQAMGNGETQTHTSKMVRILGHVSRPVHGEGRQTPDRQMFFVNGRPCGLPQFAKTFNEVYRAYNSTQSPFICADIRLDTDMYDVNVSPDKRSIMLHDQHQMLDTLRASLIALFDDHDYTVPVASISQNMQAKPEPKPSQQSTFRFTRQAAAPESPPSAQSEIDDDEAGDGSNDGAWHRTQQHTAVSLSNFARGTARRIPSANSLSRGGPHSQSLLHEWVNSKTNRSRRASSHSNASNTDDPTESAADIVKTRSEPISQHSEAEDDLSGDSGEPGVSDIETPVKVLRETYVGERQTTVDPMRSTREGGGPMTNAEPIPSLEDSKFASDSDETSSLNRSLKRSSPKLATVTIGNETSTSWIGSPAKRPRTTTIGDSERPQPSFGSRLTQLYAAEDHLASSKRPDYRPRAAQDVDHISEDETGSELEVEAADQASVAASREPSRRVGSSSGDVDMSDGDDDGRVSASSEAEADEDLSRSLHISASEDAQPRAAAFEAVRRRRDATTTLQQELQISEDNLQTFASQWKVRVVMPTLDNFTSDKVEDITDPDAESKLSLVISRGDFSRMRVAGQFNLGFIIAVRPSATTSDDLRATGADELFIIDQHASDEKYNFERLQAETIVQSQRLVQPKRLELTALEEEIVMQNLAAIEANGFKVNIDTSGEFPVGARCQLLALPLSRETTFSLTDLEELISLLGDISGESSHVPRPAKVRKMFAMRACRSSVMIGKALTHSQMYGLVKHMGEMDKPWNCPHGRPTMRHLCRLQAWDQKGWKDDVGVVERASWANYLGD
jgi:DNA mismatch repair protein PMS2